MSSPPPTIFVVHPREKRSKCTLEPLRGRPGFVFWTFPKLGPQSLEGYVRLGLDGPLLGPDDAEQGMLVLDGTWRLAERMERQFSTVPSRRLPEWKTAYPRISKLFDDPSQGLATIEALFVAFHVMGRDTTGLLDGYRWREEFLQSNAESVAAVVRP